MAGLKLTQEFRILMYEYNTSDALSENYITWIAKLEENGLKQLGTFILL